MNVALVIAPADFRDETVAKAKGMFERWNVRCSIMGFVDRECKGSHGAVYMPNANINNADPGNFDAVLIADGTGIERYRLYEVMPALDFIRNIAGRNKIVAGVGNAVKFLAKANLVSERKVAVPKDASELVYMIKLYRGIISDSDMECDTDIMSLKDYRKTEEFVGRMLDRAGVR
jgi:putative intracellular protease/amidase